MSTNNPMKNKETAQKVGLKNKRPVVVNGVRYDGTVNAATELNVATQTIFCWMKRGYNTVGEPCRYEDTTQKIYEYPNTSAKKVWIDNIRFNSVKEAAAHLGCWSETIIRAIKNKRSYKGHTFRYDNQQVSDGKSNDSTIETSQANG